MRTSLLLGLLMVAGCGDDSTPVADSGPGPDAGPGSDSGPVECEIPDTECPAEHPHPGGPCLGALSCDYPDVNMIDTWTYTCMGDKWDATATCEGPPGSSCPIPPLGEECTTPFSGMVAGGTVAIGPASSTEAFRPFTDNESVRLIYGSQGSPMVAYRIGITGDDRITCAGVHTTLTLEGTTALPDDRNIVFRCGESLTVFSIVGFDFCEMRPYQLRIDAEVDGVGSATATVEFDGGCFDG